MCNIESYVFFDIETTGLPFQERNRTKITELSFVVALRRDIIVTPHGSIPPVSKLTMVFNPERLIHPEAVKMNGLSNDLLRHAPVFRQKIVTIVSFLEDLPKPVCLVAHNGNIFDYKILLAEFCDAHTCLPDHLLCVDSLIGFRHILATTNNTKVVAKPLRRASDASDLLTDDEDEWPDLNLSTEEWQDINEICESLSDISCEDINAMKNISNKKQNQKKTVNRSDVIDKVFTKTNDNKVNYKLLTIYKRLIGKEPFNHHRAEDDCCMLLECVIAVKDDFILWADKACKRLTELKPLVRQ